MTQPKFAPILPNVEVRELDKLPPPPPWQPHRPADFRPDPKSQGRPGYGVAGPDQGYAMLLVERLAERVTLTPGEHLDDVLRGAAVIALRRAALFGRAPVTADLELALNLFGFLEAGSAAMVRRRSELFRGVAHDYWRERALVDVVPEATLRLTPQQVADRIADDPDSFSHLAG